MENIFLHLKRFEHRPSVNISYSEVIGVCIVLLDNDPYGCDHYILVQSVAGNYKVSLDENQGEIEAFLREKKVDVTAINWHLKDSGPQRILLWGEYSKIIFEEDVKENNDYARLVKRRGIIAMMAIPLSVVVGFGLAFYLIKLFRNLIR